MVLRMLTNGSSYTSTSASFSSADLGPEFSAWSLKVLKVMMMKNVLNVKVIFMMQSDEIYFSFPLSLKNK